MRGRLVATGFLLGLFGCLPDSARLALVPGGDALLTRHTASRPPMDLPPVNHELARRVALSGQKLLAANRSLEVRPQITTLGVPEEELFHRGLEEIYISEGLVERCQNEGQLTALLALQLGRAMAQREAAVGTGVSRPLPRLLPEETPVGNDNGGAHGSADGTRRMELAKMERAAKAPSVPPEPEALARVYLRRAGFGEVDFQYAERLARLADANGKLARTMVPQ